MAQTQKQIQLYNRIAEQGLARLSEKNYLISHQLTQPDAILLRSHPLALESIPDSVLAVARAGAGVNNIPVAECTRRGVVVFNTPGANANAVKELVLAGLLLTSRDIYNGMVQVQSQQASSGSELSQWVEQAKKACAGNELAGKTLGVVGLGAIGAMVAELALSLGMKVIGYDPKISIEAAWRVSSEVERADSLNALISRCDYLTLHLPGNEATRHLLSHELLSQAKPGLRLLNFARGTIVDNQALLAALDSGHVARYISDFPAPELLGDSRILLIPHLGASTAEAEQNCSRMAVRQLIDFLENGNIKHAVNFPDIALERTQGYRITFANDNVPKVLSNVLSLLADMNINVIDMLNRSHDNIAYNILDLEQQPDPDLLAAIGEVGHVFHVRAV